MGDDVLSHRLRRLGEAEVEHAVAAAQLARMAAVRPRRFTTGAAVALALTLGGSATAVGVSLAVQQPSSISTGAPPEVASTAPVDGPRTERAAPAALPPRVDSDPCIGPPPFAGIPAVDGRTRAAEANEFARLRAACHDEQESTTTTASTTTTTTPLSRVNRRGVAIGPPSSVPKGPPDSVPNGPPEGRPNGPPDSVPSGPPDSVPNGPPEGVPNGPPDSVPAGPPEGVPNGPPDSVPAGPPESVPAGPPEDVPAGPPESVPAGPPEDVPAVPPESVPAGPRADLPSDGAGGGRGGG